MKRVVTASYGGEVFSRLTGRQYTHALIANGYRGEAWGEWRLLNWCLRPVQADKRMRRRMREGYEGVRLVPVD